MQVKPIYVNRNESVKYNLDTVAELLENNSIEEYEDWPTNLPTKQTRCNSKIDEEIFISEGHYSTDCRESVLFRIRDFMEFRATGTTKFLPKFISVQLDSNCMLPSAEESAEYYSAGLATLFNNWVFPYPGAHLFGNTIPKRVSKVCKVIRSGSRLKLVVSLTCGFGDIVSSYAIRFLRCKPTTNFLIGMGKEIWEFHEAREWKAVENEEHMKYYGLIMRKKTDFINFLMSNNSGVSRGESTPLATYLMWGRYYPKEGNGPISALNSRRVSEWKNFYAIFPDMWQLRNYVCGSSEHVMYKESHEDKLELISVQGKLKRRDARIVQQSETIAELKAKLKEVK